tara:strand:+ start:537 stop:740 length:204 start_codon:yes stop_codon:yes gene_type:complete
LGDVGFVIIRELEKIYNLNNGKVNIKVVCALTNQKVLESRMLLREFKLLSLKYQNRFDFTINLRHFK